MTTLIPSLLVNPENATNNLDTHQAGWYQIQPNNSNIALRVAYSNIGLNGEIRLNTTVSPAVFQGNNGIDWINLNPTQGNTGPAGKDFTKAVNFNNLRSNTSPGTTVSLGNIFATTYANVAANISNVNIRSLQGGTYIINSNLSVNSIYLAQNSNVITINSSPLPYKWNFTTSKNTAQYLKNINNSGWGETSTWIVQTGASVSRGQAVRITKDITTNNIVIVPITYNTLSIITPISPFNMLGIATQTVINSTGQSCNVCTKGITTVCCTNNIITSKFTRSDSVSDIGIPGVVGTDGFIFNNMTAYPTIIYIKAGYFLESGYNVSSNGTYALFYVDPVVQIP